MKLEFTTDEAGYRKARILKRLISLIPILDLGDNFDQAEVDNLDTELTHFLRQPEFDPWRDDDFDDTINVKKTGLKDLLRGIFGPSRQEINLSKQREALIERAEHAEASAFEALAELAEAGKQRDEALARIRDLEAELERLKTESPAG